MYVAPTGGAEVTGVSPVRVGAGRDRMDRRVCMRRQSVGEDTVQDANGEWSVQWDTFDLRERLAEPRHVAFHGGTILTNTTITVNVSNQAPPPDPEPGAATPISAPAPISGQGYSERFSDCFDTLDRRTWCSRQWWEPDPPVGAQTVANGELRLRRLTARTATRTQR